MVIIHIGDDGNFRAQPKKHALVLIGLNHKRLTAPVAGVDAQISDDAADDKCGVKASAQQAGRQQRGCGGFTVRACHRAADAIRHQHSEQFLALQNLDALRAGCLQLRVALRNGG